MVNKLFSVSLFGTNALAIIRIITGILILKHGLVVFDIAGMNEMADYLKKELGLPLPFLMAYLAKGTELFGGLLFALGLLTRIVSIPLIITMVIAVFGAHHGQVAGEGEHAFLYLLLFVAFFFIGSGKWSVDFQINKKMK
jgi:putative oxidoreductase